ncbi:MAG: 6-phosphogluconolactonase [Elainellaceae cyanobacterium]
MPYRLVLGYRVCQIGVVSQQNRPTGAQHHTSRHHVMISSRIEVLPDKAAIVARSLDLVVKRIQSAIAEKEVCTISLAGGSTPKPLYEALANQPINWEALHVFWGDERYVAPDHPDSNQRMVRQAWLDKVPIPAANIHPIPTDTDNPQASVDQYEIVLQDFFGVEAGEFPQFDIMLLGMGDDGHTASLFPHTPALQVSDRLVTLGEKGGQTRISLTAPLINRAQCIIFMVSGSDKAPALTQVLRKDTTVDTDTYPARLVQSKGELWWLVDEPAAAQLRR